MTRSEALNELVRSSHENSREKGFWFDCEDDGGGLDRAAVARAVPEKLMLIVTEVAEAMEAVREGDLDGYVVSGTLNVTIDPKGKPLGLVSELADVVIRVADLCGALGVNLADVIERKAAYNATRAYRHGGKRA